MRVLVLLLETRTVIAASNAAHNRAMANITNGLAALGVPFDLLERDVPCVAPTPKAPDAPAE